MTIKQAPNLLTLLGHIYSPMDNQLWLISEFMPLGKFYFGLQSHLLKFIKMRSKVAKLLRSTLFKLRYHQLVLVLLYIMICTMFTELNLVEHGVKTCLKVEISSNFRDRRYNIMYTFEREQILGALSISTHISQRPNNSHDFYVVLKPLNYPFY